MSAKGTLFLTGGSRGIGAAIVLEACRQGWDVAFTYVANVDKAEEVRQSCRAIDPERKISHFELDVRDPERVDQVCDQALELLGGVDALVANAGISLNGLAYSTSDADWRTVIDTNLTGTFQVCRALLPEMVANRRGRIVMMSSVTARGASGQAAYAASKAGLEGLAASLAKEYGPKGITTNVVVPGYFDTDMTRETMSRELAAFALEYCPLRRLGTLDELSKTVLFLVGESAGFINGDAIRVTGGLDWAP